MDDASFKAHITSLKAACPAPDIAASLGLHGRGKRFFCPSCQADGAVHRTPDLCVFAGGFKCYRCGAKGDVIDLLILAGNMSKAEAIRFLEARTGLSRPRVCQGVGRVEIADSGLSGIGSQPLPPPTPPPPTKAARQDRTDHSDLYAAFLKKVCQPLVGSPGGAYLVKRGIPERLAEAFGVRFCADLTDLWNLADRTSLKAAGLTSFYPFQKAHTPFLVFPYERYGIPVFIKARCLLGKAEADQLDVPRFLNTGGSVPCLWNHDEVIMAEKVIITEGEIDALSWIVMGQNAVGLPGWSHWKDAWIKDFVGKEVVLGLDADAPGAKGAMDIAARFQRAGLPCPLTLSMPAGVKDANDYLLQFFRRTGRTGRLKW